MHLFFDIDDTLLDSSSAEHAAAHDFALAHPAVLGTDPCAFTHDWHSVSLYYYRRWTSADMTFREQRRARIRHYWGADLPDAAADLLFDEYLAFYERHWTAFPDVHHCLRYLMERYPLAVMTNGEPVQQNRKLVALGLNAYFPLVVTPQDAGDCKPNRTIFDFAAARAGAAAAECVYIGDLLEDDIRAAQRAGWCGVWLNRCALDILADVPAVHSLNELPDLINSLYKGEQHADVC